jgi:pilus assembly protein Flp/PilA
MQAGAGTIRSALGKDPSMFTMIAHWLHMAQLRREAGQGLVEYALIVVLIAVVSIAILTTLGSSVSSVFSRANAAL